MTKLLKLLTESRKLIVSLIWLMVGVVILSTVGRYLYQRNRPAVAVRPSEAAVPAPERDWSTVDAAIAEALKTARNKAWTQASAKLDVWIVALTARVDNDFLEWYFSYWTQQVIGLKGMWYWTVHKVMSDEPTLAEKITEDIQEEFSKRVLRPQISQLEIERITREVLEIYVTELSEGLKAIPSRYQIPHPLWERHLEDIALLTSTTEGNRNVSLSLKTVAVSSTVAAGMAVKTLGPVIGKVGGKVSAKLAGKATAKLAAKTGAKVAGKSGGKLAGPIIGVGVLIWDVWDHHHTKAVERPILRQNLMDYFAEMKQGFLHEPETGIISILTAMETGVLKQLQPQ